MAKAFLGVHASDVGGGGGKRRGEQGGRGDQFSLKPTPSWSPHFQTSLLKALCFQLSAASPFTFLLFSGTCTSLDQHFFYISFYYLKLLFFHNCSLAKLLYHKAALLYLSVPCCIYLCTSAPYKARID